jgi:hypothetical protein
VVGGAKKARAHIHAQACGWARWQRKLTSVARVGGVGGLAILHSITRPFFKLSSVESVEFSCSCVSFSFTWFSLDVSQPLATTYPVLCLSLAARPAERITGAPSAVEPAELQIPYLSASLLADATVGRSAPDGRTRRLFLTVSAFFAKLCHAADQSG